MSRWVGDVSEEEAQEEVGLPVPRLLLPWRLLRPPLGPALRWHHRAGAKSRALTVGGLLSPLKTSYSGSVPTATRNDIP